MPLLLSISMLKIFQRTMKNSFQNLMMQHDNKEDSHDGYLDDTLFKDNDFGSQLLEKFDPQLLQLLNEYEDY